MPTKPLVASTLTSNDDGVIAKKALIAKGICKSWDIEDIVNMLGTQLRHRFEKQAGPSLNKLSLDVLNALQLLADATEDDQMLGIVKKELEVMWGRRVHGKRPKNIGGNAEERNENFMSDIKKLTREAKLAQGVLLTVLEKEEEDAYEEQNVSEFAPHLSS